MQFHELKSITSLKFYVLAAADVIKTVTLLTKNRFKIEGNISIENNPSYIYKLRYPQDNIGFIQCDSHTTSSDGYLEAKEFSTRIDFEMSKKSQVVFEIVNLLVRNGIAVAIPKKRDKLQWDIYF